MNKPRCIATIRYSKQEVEVHINALKTFLSNDRNRIYSGPYKKLLGDMERIKEQMIDKENEAVINRDRSQPVVTGTVCEE
tara:strand:+ start:993 stop:1232 length:240 start_codon:yes stop_codon:yes gene_type:complete